MTRASTLGVALCACALLGCGDGGGEDGRLPGGGGFGNTGGMLGGGGDGAGAFGNPNGGTPGTGGGTGGAGGGGMNGSGGDEGCANVDVKPMATFSPGNLLVIFDRSVSMDGDFANGTSRLIAAGQGLIGSLVPYTCSGPVDADGTPCVDNLTVAALMFPNPGSFLSCDPILPLTDASQINWMKSTDFVQAWMTFWANNGTHLGTPIQPAFTQGAVELNAAQGNLEGNFAVLFLTDGEGTCGENAAPPEAAQWQAAGISTYVVNVNPQLGGAGTGFNDSVAAAGGSGMSINPTDQATLDAALRDVLQATAKVESCDLKLQGKITDAEGACEFGDVVLGTRKLECSDTDGYTIPDETTILLTGAACDELKAGAVLNAVFPCEVVVPQ